MKLRYSCALLIIAALTASVHAGDKPKSSVGMHDPGAQWVREGTWAGIGVQGYLDGPRRSTRSGSGPTPGGWFDDGARAGGRFIFREYDKDTECFRTAIGSTRGYLDGPFTRARFGGWGYVRGLKSVRSPDKRYIWFVDTYSGGLLRRIDFEKEEVVTLSKELGGLKAMTADGKGNLYLAKRGAVVIMDAAGTPRTQKLEVPDHKMYGHGFTVKMDDVNNRLYGMNRNGPNGWYVWYWDMSSNGKFVGALPSPKLNPDEKTRALNATGPFKGCKLHCPSGISFGGHVNAHNPKRRWLYLGGGDNTTFYRLDLEKQVFDTFGPVDIKQKKPYKDLAFVHVNKKLPTGSVVKWAGCPGLDEDGNIYLKIGVWPETIRYRRVK